MDAVDEVTCPSLLMHALVGLPIERSLVIFGRFSTRDYDLSVGSVVHRSFPETS